MPRAATPLIYRCLRLCLAARWRPEAMAEAQALAQAPGFQWEALAGLAEEEELAPLLYAALQRQTWAPVDVMQRLRAAYMRNASRNALLLAELEQALARLAAAGIPALALKGAALTARLYGNIGLRPMVDLDLLVRREDMTMALATLEAAGYRRPHAEPSTGVTLAFENEIVLRRADRIEVALELHWSLFDSPYYQKQLPTLWFWQTAELAHLGDTPVHVLGAEGELLHLCGHLALHHHGQGLLWEHDIAAVMAQGQQTLDWEELLARAKAFDLVLPLQTLLPRLAADWGVPVPAGILAHLETLAASSAEARVYAQLTATRRPVLQRFLADLASMPSWGDRLRYAWAHAFPAPAYMRERYGVTGAALLVASYPYRWFTGVREVVQRGWVR